VLDAWSQRFTAIFRKIYQIKLTFDDRFIIILIIINLQTYKLKVHFNIY
jgi:hypothetical protein